MKSFKTVASVFASAFILCSGAIMAAESPSQLVYVASKTKGLCVYRMDSKTGAMMDLGVAAEVSSPQFIAIHPNRRFLFTLNNAMVDGKKTGVVSGFSIEPKTGKLTFVNHQPSGGTGPTHLVVDHAGKNVLLANYGSGSVSVFPIQKGGLLGAATAFIQHKGSSVNPQRQEGPHAHQIVTDAADRFALVCDLGLDKVLVYKFDSAKGSIVANNPPAQSIKAGAGPRHLAFHPNGKFFYVINELDSTMTVFNYDANRGAMHEVQTISTLPKDFTGKNFPAEVAVHPNGKFVYGSNRGHDSIVVFAIDKTTGELSLVQHQSTAGKIPRHFEIDTKGKFLLAANQESGKNRSNSFERFHGRL